MGYIAVDCVEDAYLAARRFLLPVDRGRWLRLLVIVFFLTFGSGASSVPSMGVQIPNVSGDVTRFEVVGFQGEDLVQNGDLNLGAVPEEVWLLLGLLLVAAVVFGTVFVLVGSIMQFVLVEAFRREEVAVWKPFKRYLRAGLAVFLFRVLLLLAVLVPIGFLAFVLFLPFPSTGAGIAVAILTFVLVAFALGVLGFLVHELTVEFVVPIMIAESCGILTGWGHLWGIIRANLGQVVLYVLLRWGIAMAVSFIAGIATAILAAVVFVPLGLLGLGLGFAANLALTMTMIVLGVFVALVAGLIALTLVAVVQVPLVTYTTYYELLVLGDLAPEYDLVSDARGAVRSNGEEANGAGGSHAGA